MSGNIRSKFTGVRARKVASGKVQIFLEFKIAILIWFKNKQKEEIRVHYIKCTCFSYLTDLHSLYLTLKYSVLYLF